MGDAPCEDDPSIADDEILWRYVHQTQLTTDNLTGRVKPASGAFRDKHMSVDVASMTSIPIAQARNPGKFIAKFAAADVRKFGKYVTHAIDPDPENPAHAVVCPKLSQSEARILSDQVGVWVLAPQGE